MRLIGIGGPQIGRQPVVGSRQPVRCPSEEVGRCGSALLGVPGCAGGLPGGTEDRGALGTGGKWAGRVLEGAAKRTVTQPGEGRPQTNKVQSSRKGFLEVKAKIRAMNIRYMLLYTAGLKVLSGGRSHFFKRLDETVVRRSVASRLVPESAPVLADPNPETFDPLANGEERDAGSIELE
ncbi:hypothetical protein NDU88_004606 [Pleurodeles waltl]|uniref:Uncharacterized protein n=1 Tax=Pleurodeles waltl TaxID=8319 RepID=A0AAV7PI15_PLEWA|nr:hypothetical protein NDU88_004606 [Pleurodeles waltl]